MKIEFEIASRWQLAELLERLDLLQSLMAEACTQDEFDELIQHLNWLRGPILMALKQKWEAAFTAYSEHHEMIAHRRKR